jgi:hypothetical protein
LSVLVLDPYPFQIAVAVTSFSSINMEEVDDDEEETLFSGKSKDKTRRKEHHC